MYPRAQLARALQSEGVIRSFPDLIDCSGLQMLVSSALTGQEADHVQGAS